MTFGWSNYMLCLTHVVMCVSNWKCPTPLWGRGGDITFVEKNIRWRPQGGDGHIWWCSFGYSVMSRGLGCKVMVMSPPRPHRGVGHLEFEAHITVTYLNHTLHFTHYIRHCGIHMITVIWSRKCANLSLLAAYSGNDKFFLFGSNIITKG